MRFKQKHILPTRPKHMFHMYYEEGSEFNVLHSCISHNWKIQRLCFNFHNKIYQYEMNVIKSTQYSQWKIRVKEYRHTAHIINVQMF